MISHWVNAPRAKLSASAELKQELILRDAKIKDLRNRVFGKKGEKRAALPSEKGQSPGSSKRPRGHVRRDYLETGRSFAEFKWIQRWLQPPSRRCRNGADSRYSPDENRSTYIDSYRTLPARIFRAPVERP